MMDILIGMIVMMALMDALGVGDETKSPSPLMGSSERLRLAAGH